MTFPKNTLIQRNLAVGANDLLGGNVVIPRNAQGNGIPLIHGSAKGDARQAYAVTEGEIGDGGDACGDINGGDIVFLEESVMADMLIIFSLTGVGENELGIFTGIADETVSGIEITEEIAVLVDELAFSCVYVFGIISD